MVGTLGRGGFGTVYRADLLGEGAFVRAVALKVLHPEMEEVATIAARLRDEARLLGRIRHRAVVQVDGLVRIEDRWTIVMEYVDGVDLGRLLDAGPVPPRAALEIVGEIAGALDVAHHWPGDDGRPLGLLHRDIKPANLLLTAAGEVKVLDFGVARVDLAAREAETRGMRFGSPGYVAPERLEGDERPEGDVYSLGVVAYELLAGRRLGRPSVRRDRSEAWVAAALDALEGPEEVVGWVRRMLSWDPAGRPTSREVERHCRALASSLSGPFLRDWAEGVVPPLLATRVLSDPGTAFSSEVVTEGRSGSLSEPPPAVAAASSPVAGAPPPAIARAPAPSAAEDLGLLGSVVLITVALAFAMFGAGCLVAMCFGGR